MSSCDLDLTVTLTFKIFFSFLFYRGMCKVLQVFILSMDIALGCRRYDMM